LVAVLFAGWPIGSWSQDLLPRHRQLLEAIEQLEAQGAFQAAVQQAEAAYTIGREDSNSELMARARLLRARSYLAIDSTDAANRIAAIQDLRESALLFQEAGNEAAARDVAQQLERIVAAPNSSTPSLRLPDAITATRPRRQRLSIRDRLDSLEVESMALAALVSAQHEAIEDLNETQIRQVLRLNRQQQLIDSFAIVALEDSLLILQQNNDLETERNAAREQRLQRNFFLLLAAAVLILAFAIWSRYRNSRSYQSRLEQKNNALEAERRRSEELLLNILPRGVARELKNEGKAVARRYEFVSVLFADFAGFSRLAADLEPEELITRLDKAFRAFDRIVAEEGLEKIKTIGDAYMCAGGLPEPLDDHVERTVRAAFRMQDYLRTNPDFKARIGIHAGPVIAGVVGLHKFAYDIWGDTVNLAARLEEAGRTGKVNVSGIVCRRLPPVYPCKHRGKISTKNTGEIDMYFVEKPGTK
jgi:class 3 adenylate cyclase